MKYIYTKTIISGMGKYLNELGPVSIPPFAVFQYRFRYGRELLAILDFLWCFVCRNHFDGAGKEMTHTSRFVRFEVMLHRRYLMLIFSGFVVEIRSNCMF